MEKLHATANYLLNPTHPITITLIGAGGTGSLILSRLARMDYALKQFNHPGLLITVFDDDIVEQYNVGRQMFSSLDIGENKAFCLVSKINRSFLTKHVAKMERFDCSLTENNANIYITAVDNAAFRVDFNDFFKNKKTNYEYQKSFYWMDFGNAKNVGQCVLGSTNIQQNSKKFVGQLKTVIDLFPSIAKMDTTELQGEGCSYQAKLNEQNLFINDSLTALGAHLLWELLTVGYIDKNGFFLNLDSLKSNPIKIA